MKKDKLQDRAELPTTWRKVLLIGIAAAGLIVGCTEEAPVSASRPPSVQEQAHTENELVSGEFSINPTWEQNFSRMPNGPVDSSVWRFDLNPEVPGYNDEAQGYTNSPRNVRIEEGSLVLEAHREHYRYPNDPQDQLYEITSGRVDTLGSFHFEYGKIEATMKLPKGEGTWPAFWLLSANGIHTSKLHPTDADWAEPRFYMHDGELDVMEHYGNDPGLIEATAHTYRKSHEGHTRIADATDLFHTYGVEVTPTRLVWTIDGVPYFEFKKPSGNPDEWPFGEGNELYVILNLAMGGEGGGRINPAEHSWRMEVKNLRFYEYTQ